MMQEFVQSIKNAAKKAVDGIHTAVPAVIVSYDPASGKAVVQPKAKFRKPDGTTIEYPSVSGVPVMFPQSQNITVAFPVKAGDGCLLVFAETALDYWLYGTETSSELRFDLSSAIALPGIAAAGSGVMAQACREDAVIVKVGATALKVSTAGVEITGKLTVTGEVRGNSVALSTHTHGVNGSTTEPPDTEGEADA